jgi:alpha-tubulin suppressor-like RCC1 family protein
VAAGSEHTCALLDAGGTKCWGNNGAGQLGDGTTTWRTTPVDVSGLASGVTALALGYQHTCALLAGGGVQCWGDNRYGQLGDGTLITRTTPVDVSGLASGVTALALGYQHTCALSSTGGVQCWGSNEYGQLGNGTAAITHTTPVEVAGLGSGVTAIAADGGHTCALTATGGVKCWGLNWVGELGDGTLTNRDVPVDVVGLSSGVTAIAAGGGHTCALLVDGAVQCWGDNRAGAVGTRTSRSQAIPTNVSELGGGVRAITAGGGHTCALLGAGRVKCWGAWDSRTSYDPPNPPYSTTPIAVAGLGGAGASTAAGGWHTCMLLANGSVQCWGWNVFGQLGNGTFTFWSELLPVMGLGSGATALAAGNYHTCALVPGGGVKCWGRDSFGQLGAGPGSDQPAAVDVMGLPSGAVAVGAGVEHSCAALAAGGVKCWGRNHAGQLGDSTRTDREVPVDVVGLGSGATAITAGEYHTCALLATGGVQCWGDNGAGQLGDGTKASHLTPVDVVGLSAEVTAVAAGSGHTCALTATGGVKCWGANYYGQLGDGTLTSREVPVEVVGLGSGATAIAAGGYHTCALLDAGAVKCWGNRVPVATDVVGLTSGLTAIAVGGGHTCALLASGGVKCWGANEFGQLGFRLGFWTPVLVIGFEGYRVLAPLLQR